MFSDLEVFWGNIFNNKDRQKKKTEIEFLRDIPFFSNLSKKQVIQVEQILHKRFYSEGECFFELNQPGAALFIVESGNKTNKQENEDLFAHFNNTVILIFLPFVVRSLLSQIF